MNSHILESRDGARSIISEHLIDRRERTGDLFSVERYEGVENQVLLYSCAISPDGIILSTGTASNLIIGPRDALERGYVEPSGVGLVDSIWSDDDHRFFVVGADRETGYLYEVFKDGSSGLLARSDERTHFVSLTQFQGQIIMSDALSTTLFVYDGAAIVPFPRPPGGLMGRGIAVFSNGPRMTAIFTDGIAIFDGDEITTHRSPSVE